MEKIHSEIIHVFMSFGFKTNNYVDKKTYDAFIFECDKYFKDEFVQESFMKTVIDCIESKNNNYYVLNKSFDEVIQTFDDYYQV